jgi:ligand-binding sensor domain-containing protein
MSLFKFYILCSCLTVFLNQAVAQFPFSKKIEIEEENLTLKANVLLKDHFGFIWIGTSEGLFKYNSITPEKIPDSRYNKFYITALYEDDGGIIWAGCKSGQILMYKNNVLSLYKPEEGLPKVSITNIYQDAKKRMWFATAGEGVYYKDTTHLYNINSKDGLSDDNVNCLYSPDRKQIIVGTDRGLSFIELEEGKKNIYFFTSKDGLPDNIVRCIIPTQKKDIAWIGMQSKGILLFNFSTNKIEDSLNKTAWQYGQINDITDTKEELFIATEQNGIIGYNKARHAFGINVLQDSVFPKRIADVQTDNEGAIWLATENKLVSFTGNYLRYWYGSKKTPLIKIHTLLADDDNKLWFTPDLRLFETQLENLQDEKHLARFDITPPKDHIDITGLYKDKYGYLWIGTMGEGLFRMNIQTGKWRRIAENPIAFFGNILSVAGKNNQVWISTLNGVARFDLTENNYDLQEKIQFKNYSKKDGLGSDYIYHILIDTKGRVWFATDGAGVAIYENNIFTNFYNNKLFPSKVTYSLTEDRNKHIWVSTYNDGLFEYDGKKFIQYNTKNGLTDLAITSIAVDEYNNIIAVNKKGIDIFNPRHNIVQHYGAESGFFEQQPNLNAITKDITGNIWIGTDNGIVRLNSQPSFSAYIPVAVIESVELFNTSTDTSTTHSYTYDQNNFTFKLAAAYYKAPEKIKFQYWLEGYSKKWETTSDKIINFPKLEPGKYSIKVRASASNNFETSIIANYSFSISKPFWTTWWFRTISLLSFAAIIFWIFKQRVKSIRKSEHAEREKFQLQYDALKNQVNPHFLFNSFNALMNIVEENPKEATILIKHLSQFYRKMTAYSQKDLITLNEELELLNSYLYIQQKRYGQALQVSINVEAELKSSAYIPPLVLQLLAENAIKHNTISKYKPLLISINIEDGDVVILNNINKKLEKEEGEGVGLENIKNRYKLLTNKEMMIKNDDDKFIIKLPLIYSV